MTLKLRGPASPSASTRSHPSPCQNPCAPSGRRARLPPLVSPGCLTCCVNEIQQGSFVATLIRNLWQKKGEFPRAKLSAVKTAAALSPRSGAQRAHSGHHRARHILPRGFDFATFPSFRRLRPPGALQAAAPSAEPLQPCRACRPRSSPLPRSWRQLQARRRAPMAVERQRKVVGLQLPSCLHCCLTCRRRLTMRLQSVIKSQG